MVLGRSDILSAIEREISALRSGTVITDPGYGERWVAVLEAAVAELKKPPMLWCCHIRGPDDVIACDSYDAALQMSDELNAVSRRINAQFPATEQVWYSAAPAPWPWGAEAHAEDLKRQRDEAARAAQEAPR